MTRGDKNSRYNTCDALRNLVQIVQFKRLEKHPWGSVTKSATISLTNFKKPTILRENVGFLKFVGKIQQLVWKRSQKNS